jgi:hypothetical protein
VAARVRAPVAPSRAVRLRGLAMERVRHRLRRPLAGGPAEDGPAAASGRHAEYAEPTGGGETRAAGRLGGHGTTTLGRGAPPARPGPLGERGTAGRRRRRRAADRGGAARVLDPRQAAAARHRRRPCARSAATGTKYAGGAPGQAPPAAPPPTGAPPARAASPPAPEASTRAATGTGTATRDPAARDPRTRDPVAAGAAPRAARVLLSSRGRAGALRLDVGELVVDPVARVALADDPLEPLRPP